MAKAAMMVALSGSVALVVTVEDHKTMAEGGAQTRPPPHNAVHTNTCQNTNTRKGQAQCCIAAHI